MGGMAIAGLGSVVSGGLGFLGSSNQASASRDAANIQAQSQREALAQQQAQYNQNRADLAPYRDIGSYAGGQLTNRLTDLTSPIKMDQATLEQTPGYQFNLTQGLKATQSAAAARGLGVSGAALKGAASYATGLADNTYQNQFNNANTNQTNAYNRLYQTTALGANAATGGALLGQSNANSQGSLMVGAGNAQAAGILGSSAASASGLNSAGNSINALTSMYYANNRNGGGSGLFGGSGNTYTPDYLSGNSWGNGIAPTPYYGG